MKRLGGLLMRLFPADFRARYGPEVRDLLVEYGRDVRRREGWWGFSRLMVFQGTDLLLAARAERRATRSSGAVRDSGVAFGGAPPPRHTGPRGLQRLVEALRADLHFAWRSLRRTPTFLAVAGLTLALGIGATTAIFTVLYGSLLAPLPYPQADDLVVVWLRSPALEFDRISHTTSTYLTYRDEQDAFAEFGAFLQDGAATITGEGDPERIETIGVTDGALRALGARAALGRLYGPGDVEPGAEPKLILSHGFWQRRYGADEGIVGRTIRFEGTPVEVIGVLPADFRFLGRQPAAYWPIRLDAGEMPTVLSFDYGVIARLADGVSGEQAEAELTALIPASVERYAWLPQERLEEWNLSANVRPLKEAVVSDVGSLLWVLFGTVSIVLVIACVNVANLCLVRAESRRREIAVRSALGASRGVLARQFVVESVVLGAIGGALGLVIAYAAVPLLLQVTPTSLPRADDIGIEPATLAFCVGISFLAGLLFSLFPVLSFAAPRVSGALKDGDRSSSNRAAGRLRTALAIGEVAMALILLVGAGLMIRSFVALKGIDPGFSEPEQALTFRLSLSPGEYPDVDRAVLAYQEVLTAIEEIPGVEHAGVTSGLTMEGRSNQNSFIAEGVDVGAEGGVLNGSYKAIAGDYFDAAGIPLLAGRNLSWDDIRERRQVGLVTARVARHFWGSPEAAVGRRIRHSGDDPWREIVGVVGDVRDAGLRAEPRAVAFWPVVVDDFLGFETWLRRDVAFVVRVAGAPPTSLLPAVRQAVWATNPDLPLTNVATLESVIDTNLASTSFTLLMLLIASGVAVTLGTIGIYGVIAYAFAQRRREIGVRIALGAAHRDIRGLVLRQGAWVGIAGVVLGTLGAIGLARFLQSMVYDVGTLDPVTYAAAGLLTGGIAMLASYMPALRASRTDPLQALRQ